jgi:hypoxia up-regulated 1
LGDKFYSYSLGYGEERGVPTFYLTGENATEGEEALGSILHFARKMAEDSSDGKSVRDLVVTMPSDASLRQRQAVVAAGEIAGMRVLTLVHEGAAFAVQRAVDFQPEKNTSMNILFYNMGSRKTEVSIVKFESRSAGMVAGKTAPVVTVLGNSIDFSIGGHLMDLKIAEAMLAKFQEKNPKLAAGIVESPRALRKLLSQAQKTKATLSANKAAPFIVESVFEDTDFQTTIKREEFEQMCEGMFASLTSPIDKALKMAGLALEDIQAVELVGGAWRVPKVQQRLGEFFEKANQDKKMQLGQHLNGEEAAALGAALVAANSSSSFRVKKIFFTDITSHEYAVQVMSLDGKWAKNLTTLYPAGTALGGKKKLSFTMEEDFKILVFEDGVLMHSFEITGLKDLLEGKWKEYNMTGPPKISASVPLEMSGIIEVKVPTATVEEAYWINVTKKIPKNKTAANGTNGTENDTDTENGTDAGNTSEESEEKEAPESSEESASNDSNDSNASGNATDDDEVEIIQKLKKKKHEKKLTVVRTDFLPMPFTDDQIAVSKSQLEEVDKREAEVLAVAGMKNELEAAIYGSRDKLERSDIIKVSTEEQREEVLKLCTEYEEWMYEGGVTKSDYETRITKLSDELGPIEERALELESREDLPDQVGSAVADMKKDHAHIEKNMSWVGANKTEAALTKLTEFEGWWAKKQEQQAALPLHEAPAFTKKEVMEKVSKLQKEWDKLKKIKKPKEKTPPKPKKNDTKGNKTAEKPAEPEELPTDIKVVEEEIESLRQKKAAAVENEDFDTAQTLKKRESVLAEHLKTLQQKAEL